ncbi:transposase [Streptomyces sp. NPDC005349]|uniref:transposase n=1 Tax=Streptomyces sp. NPDC005349 TaxID=3157037 RepID=UPI0033AA54AE
MISRGNLTDDEWALMKPLLLVSNNRCGRWRDHRQVINGIIHRLGTSAQWRELPERFGPWQTVHKRHALLSADGTWDWTCSCSPSGQRADCTQFQPVLDKIRVPRTGVGRPRRTPDRVAADRAYSNRRTRAYLRRRGIQHVIPEKKDHKAARLRRCRSRGLRGCLQCDQVVWSRPGSPASFQGWRRAAASRTVLVASGAARVRRGGANPKALILLTVFSPQFLTRGAEGNTASESNRSTPFDPDW